MAFGPIYPSSGYPADTAGRLFQNYYAGAGGNLSPHDEGWGVKASLDADATLELRFPIPNVLPAGTLKLDARFLANAGAGAIKYTISDASVSPGASPSAAALTSEAQSTVTWGAGDNDKYKQLKTPLSATPVAGDILVMAIKFQTTGWTLAQTLTGIFSIIWE